MDKVVENLSQQEWYQERVKAMAAQKDKKIFVQRDPHPMELGFTHVKGE